MTKRVPRDQYPWWVKFGLIGWSSRGALWAWVVLSLLTGLGLVAFGLWADRPAYAVGGAIGGPVAALMYWLTIRWVDRHGSWE